MTHFIGTDNQAMLNAIAAVERAAQTGHPADIAAAEAALNNAKVIAARYNARPGEELVPGAEDLAAKRDARLFRETLESLSEGDRADFERLYGHTATMRRLAAEAKAQADTEWERAETERIAAEYQGGMWDGADPTRQRLPGANWDKLFKQTEELEKRRLARIQAREEREVIAEAWNEEQPRILAGMDAREQELFLNTMRAQPSMLERLNAFKKSRGLNPIADVNDPGTLYDMGLEEDAALHPYRRYDTPTTMPGESGAEVEDLYRQALKDMTKDG